MPKYRIERTEMVTRIWVVDAETEEDALDSYPNEEPEEEWFGMHPDVRITNTIDNDTVV